MTQLVNHVKEQVQWKISKHHGTFEGTENKLHC